MAVTARWASAQDGAGAPSAPGTVSPPTGTTPFTDMGTGVVPQPPSAFVSDPTKVGQDYVLGPGDTFDVDVYPQAKYSLQNVSVGQSGSFFYTEIGDVDAMGKTIGQLKTELESMLSKYCVHPNVTIIMKALHPLVVFVTGGVPQQKALDVRAASDVVRAVTLAGGATDRNSLSHIAVLRGEQVLPADVYPILINGSSDQTGNLKLEPGDMVIVPTNTKRFSVAGAVGKPGVYPLSSAPSSNEGPFRLTDALFDAGNPNGGHDADIGHVIIYRPDPATGKMAGTKYDFSKALKGDQSQNPEIQDKDFIFVPEQKRHVQPGDLFQIPAFIYLFKFFGVG